MLFPPFLETNNSGNKLFFLNNSFSYNVFFVCFFYARSISNIFWKYWKVPLHLLVKWEVVSPNGS